MTGSRRGERVNSQPRLGLRREEATTYVSQHMPSMVKDGELPKPRKSRTARLEASMSKDVKARGHHSPTSISGKDI